MADEPGRGRQFLTVAEVAAELRVDPETVRRWIRTGALRATEIGGRRAGLRVERAHLEAYIEQRHIELGGRGQPLGVAIPQHHVGELEHGAPRTAIALLDERALFAQVADHRLGAPLMCFLCGGKTESLPPWRYRCLNPRCRKIIEDIMVNDHICDDAICRGGITSVYEALRVKRASTSGLAQQVWGVMQCNGSDQFGLYHWTRTREHHQITLIRWEGHTRHSLTQDGSALQVNTSRPSFHDDDEKVDLGFREDDEVD